MLEFGTFVREAVIALDKVLTGESGEISVYGRRIKFKAKWRVHSFDEPIVWDATAQDMETGIRVEAKHSDTDKDANRFAIKKLCEALREQPMSQGSGLYTLSPLYSAQELQCCVSYLCLKR